MSQQTRRNSRRAARRNTTCSARNAALAALQAVREGALSAAEVLVSSKEYETLGPKDRRLAYEITAGTLKHYRPIDLILSAHTHRAPADLDAQLHDILRLSTYQLLYLSRVPTHAVVNEGVELAHRHARRGSEKLVNAVLRKVSQWVIDRVEAPEPALIQHARVVPASGQCWVVLKDPLPLRKGFDEKEYFSAAYSLPLWLVEALYECFSPEAAHQCFHAWNAAPPLTLRLNRSRAAAADISSTLHPRSSPQPYRQFSLTAADQPPTLFDAPAGLLPQDIPELNSGVLSVQDAASASVVPWMLLKPGMHVLDMCAAPGGKTIQIADALEDQGEILACDISESRLSLVKENAHHSGFHCIETRCINAANLSNADHTPFDRILLDAPCSNTGVLARRWEVRMRLSKDSVEKCIPLQIKLLSTALRLIKPGGRIVYSTCSILNEENEDVVQAVLGESTGFQLLASATYLPTFLSHEGMYVAIIERLGT